jgi:hypothetical protein
MRKENIPAKTALLNNNIKGKKCMGDVFIEISSYPEDLFEGKEEITFPICLVVILLKIILGKGPLAVKFR